MHHDPLVLPVPNSQSHSIPSIPFRNFKCKKERERASSFKFVIVSPPNIRSQLHNHRKNCTWNEIETKHYWNKKILYDWFASDQKRQAEVQNIRCIFCSLYPSNSHQSYYHQVVICHIDDGWGYDTITKSLGNIYSQDIPTRRPGMSLYDVLQNF